MSNSGIPSPLFPFLLLLTLTPSLAYPPCSSLQTSPLTSETLTHLSTGCTLQPHDPFIITLQSNPNLQISHLQIHLRTPKDTISFTLLKTNDGYNLQTINDRVSQSDNTYITPPQAIVFEVKNGSYSLNLLGSSITSSHKLNNVTTYLLTIQISEPGFLSHASSARFLEQCGNGTFLMGGSCLRACPAKFYASKGVCWHCSCPNGKCISENQCNPCTSGQVYFHETQTCVDECPDTYFEDSQNQVCAKCADGCTSCSYPDGNCNSGFIKLDPVLCVLVAVAALAAIIAVVWYWKMFKAKPKQPTKKKKKQQQPEQNAESSPKAKSKLAQLRRFGDAMTPVGPYNIMPEPPEHHDEDEEEMSPGGRNRRRKLTTVAQTKLLTVSRSKTFQVDDDNHEQAVDHGSPAMRPKLSSLTMLSTKGGESPAIRPRKAGKKTSKILSSRSRQDTQENKMLSIPIDESGAMQQSFELASPANASTPKRDTSTSLGFITLKKVDTTDTPLNNQDSAQASDRKEENDFAKVVEAVEEAEERDEEDEEKKEKEGYKPDLSLSISMDEDHMVELMTCTICGMNKRDCVNKPCGHMLGCYACMQQFREKYGVCPRCKVPILKLEKTGELKIKAKSPTKEEE